MISLRDTLLAVANLSLRGAKQERGVGGEEEREAVAEGNLKMARLLFGVLGFKKKNEEKLVGEYFVQCTRVRSMKFRFVFYLSPPRIIPFLPTLLLSKILCGLM